MSHLIHTICREILYADLSKMYLTVGKVMINGNGELFIGNGTLLPIQKNNKSILDAKFFCQRCNKVLNLVEDEAEVGANCYGCGHIYSVDELIAINGYFLCTSCRNKHSKDGKKIDITKIKIPYIG